MNYQFFIQGTDTGEHDQEFRLIMVLDTGNRDSLAQTSIQALITRHQMHTCVNIPFRYKRGNLMKFEPGYAEMDGEVHPILKIVTDKYGAFRLPFPSGAEGYQIFQKTYKEIQYRLIQHKNRHLNRVGSEPVHARRLEAPKAKAKPESPKRSTAQKVKEPPKPTRAQAQVTKKPAANRKRETSADQNWWRRQPESLRWLVGGLTAGVLVASILFTGKAFAGELPASATNDRSLERELLEVGVSWGASDAPPAGCLVSASEDPKSESHGCGPSQAFEASTAMEALPGLAALEESKPGPVSAKLEDELAALGADLNEVGARYAGFPVPEIVEAPEAQVVDGCSIPQASGESAVEFSLPGLNVPNEEI